MPETYVRTDRGIRKVQPLRYRLLPGMLVYLEVAGSPQPILIASSAGLGQPFTYRHHPYQGADLEGGLLEALRVDRGIRLQLTALQPQLGGLLATKALEEEVQRLWAVLRNQEVPDLTWKQVASSHAQILFEILVDEHLCQKRGRHPLDVVYRYVGTGSYTIREVEGVTLYQITSTRAMLDLAKQDRLFLAVSEGGLDLES